jgi:hypothetical protein
VLTKIAIDNHIAVGDWVGMTVFSDHRCLHPLDPDQLGAFHVMTRVGQRDAAKMRSDMFRHMQRLP